jgi:hypothetical protein
MLSYRRNVIQETMRMYPPIWSLARKPEAGDVIGGHEIKARDTIVRGTYVADHNPRFWDHPERFDPDRFAVERAKGRAPYSYLPSGGGKRPCIGSSMSQIEAAFEFEYARDQAPRISLTVTLSPKQGLPPSDQATRADRDFLGMPRAPAARRTSRSRPGTGSPLRRCIVPRDFDRPPSSNPGLKQCPCRIPPILPSTTIPPVDFPEAARRRTAHVPTGRATRRSVGSSASSTACWRWAGRIRRDG